MKPLIKGLLQPNDYAFVKIGKEIYIGRIATVKKPRYQPPFTKSRWKFNFFSLQLINSLDPTKYKVKFGGWYSIDDLLLFGFRMEE
jgi:hypothetical protein